MQNRIYQSPAIYDKMYSSMVAEPGGWGAEHCLSLDMILIRDSLFVYLFCVVGKCGLLL